MHIHNIPYHIFCFITYIAEYFSCKILKHIQYHNSCTRSLWKGETCVIVLKTHIMTKQLRHSIAKWLTTLRRQILQAIPQDAHEVQQIPLRLCKLLHHDIN